MISLWPCTTIRGTFRSKPSALYMTGKTGVEGCRRSKHYTGLPIIRTSVDHGTGFDQAGKGTSNELSLLNAIQYAVTMARNRNIKE